MVVVSGKIPDSGDIPVFGEMGMVEVRRSSGVKQVCESAKRNTHKLAVYHPSKETTTSLIIVIRVTV